MLSHMLGVERGLQSWPSTGLRISLIVVAAVLVILALTVDSPLFLAGLLAWVVLP